LMTGCPDILPGTVSIAAHLLQFKLVIPHHSTAR
jgi:hypothetical protein